MANAKCECINFGSTGVTTTGSLLNFNEKGSINAQNTPEFLMKKGLRMRGSCLFAGASGAVTIFNLPTYDTVEDSEKAREIENSSGQVRLSGLLGQK